MPLPEAPDPSFEVESERRDDGRSGWGGNTIKAFLNAFFTDEVKPRVKHVQSPRDVYFYKNTERKNFAVQLTVV